MTSLLILATAIAADLGATPQADPPARATFAGGLITLGANELCIVFDGVGGLFVSIVAGRIVIEAIAIANQGEPRRVIERRHAELEGHGRRLFGADNIEARDPLGLRGGAGTAVWS